MKIRTETPEISKKIQEHSFKLGYNWLENPNKEILWTDKYGLQLDELEGGIFLLPGEKTFSSCKEKEITAKEFLKTQNLPLKAEIDKHIIIKDLAWYKENLKIGDRVVLKDVFEGINPHLFVNRLAGGIFKVADGLHQDIRTNDYFFNVQVGEGSWAKLWRINANFIRGII